MNLMDAVRENVIIDAWAGRFRRSPDQRNEPHETDAELVEMPGEPDRYLAVTIDTVSEEIAEGIYRDPHTAGWVTAIASLSDLAAVGADPLGLLIAASVPREAGDDLAHGIAEGIEYACRAHGVFVLGGDTNFAQETSLTACAVGIVPREYYLSRRGAQPGDAVFLSGPSGAGNALAFARVSGLADEAFPESTYRPTAELRMGHLLRGFASCCMDTSDGVLAALDQLMRTNEVGFVVDCDCDRLLDTRVLAFCNATHTPRWLMAAGPHGEFRLLFTVPPPKVAGFLEACEREGLAPLSVGTVQQTPAVAMRTGSQRMVEIDIAAIRNLLLDATGDMSDLIRTLKDMGEELGLD